MKTWKERARIAYRLAAISLASATVYVAIWWVFLDWLEGLVPLVVIAPEG